MKPETTFDLLTATRRDAKRWTQETVTWGEVIEWLEDPADHKECGGYVFGKFSAPRRRTETLVSRSAIVLDADRAPEGFLSMLELTFGYAAAIHSTYSHLTEGKGSRYRLIIPTDRDLKPEEYRPAARQLMGEIGEEYFDLTSDEAARFMYRPSAADPSLYESLVIDGPPVSADRLLRDNLIPESVRKTKRDPFSLSGVPGAFNRAYLDLSDLVESYDLPYVHEGADRWKLVGASSVAGVGEISDGLWYSHHAGDPAHGHAQTAFDLVRIHRFGHLDADAKPETPINRLPSFAEAVDLVAADPRVRELLVSDFDTVEEEEPEDWTLKLKVVLSGRNAGKTEDNVFNWNLIREKDKVFQSLTYNEMTSGVETREDLPWRSKDNPSPTFNRNDRTELRARIEKLYGFKPDREHLSDLVNAQAARQPHHPIRDYLDGLEWDGRGRMETSLPGVEPTSYTRMVARRVLIAAVARIFQPGCKWDHTLVLYGKEGLGKSFWAHRMARGFSASLGRIGDKDTLLTMQRSWIMMADEGHAVRGASFDAAKEFLTKTDDTFRRPYEAEAQLVKRHSVIWTTTNSKNFLDRAEGNRRFLIVHCEGKVDFSELTDDYIDQVWAEAVAAYKSGEQWHLTEAEDRIAAEARESYTLDDPRVGLVHEYLGSLVPVGWETKSPEERLWWFKSRGDSISERGTEPIDMVCAAQILVEGLGRRLGEWRPEEHRIVVETMDAAEGWDELPDKVEVPMYGIQQVWVRRNTS